ncbi:MAG: hypothetical protein NVS3B7_12690 [Candidatus Elarobacter sp.]
MTSMPDPKRVVGALRFLAELASIAAECDATGIWDDELAARRRQRDDTRVSGETTAEVLTVKAL